MNQQGIHNFPIYYCQEHKNEQIINVSLKQPRDEQQQISICKICNSNNREDSISLDKFFLFIEKCRANNNLFNGISSLFETIQKIENTIKNYLNNIREELNNIKNCPLNQKEFLNDVLKNHNKIEFLNERCKTIGKFVDVIVNESDVTLQIKKNWNEQNYDILKQKIVNLEDIISQYETHQSQQSLIIEQQNRHQLNINEIKINVMKFNNIDNTILVQGGQFKNNGIISYLKLFKYQQNKLSFLQNLKGHNDEVINIAFSNINNSFVSGSTDNKIIYWKEKIKEQWEQIQLVEQDSIEQLTCLLFNKKSNLLISSADYIYFWKFNQEQQEFQKKQEFTEHKEKVLSIGFNNDCNLLITGSKNYCIFILQEQNEDWKIYKQINQNSLIQFVSFINNQDFLFFTMSQKFSIYCPTQTDYNKYKKKFKFQILSFCFSEKEQILAICNSNQQITVYKILNQGQRKRLFQLTNNQKIIALSNDGNLIAYIKDNEIQIHCLPNSNNNLY